MKLEGKKIGVVITGSFCTFKNIIVQLKKIKEQNAEIIPVMSYNAYNWDTKFGKATDFIEEIQKITRKKNNSYNPRSGNDWFKVCDRYNDNIACYRKYDGKTC